MGMCRRASHSGWARPDPSGGHRSRYYPPYVVGGTLVGSVAPMNLCVANMVRSVGCSLAEAVKLTSLNPASVIGVDDRKGRLKPGMDAGLVLIDEEVNVYVTMVKGQEVYRADAW